MDIQKLEILLKSIDIGSLTKTSEVLGYSQSALSHAISTLESELGASLLVRGRNGVGLTMEGRELLPYIQAVTNSYRELQNKIAQPHKLDYGTIRIGTYTSTAVHWLPGILNTFRTMHPSVNFEVKYGNYGGIIQWVVEGSIDCGFSVNVPKEGAQHLVLREEPLYVLFPPNHPLEKLDIVEPTEISKYPYIHVIEGDVPIIYNFFKDRNIPLQIQYRVVDDYAAVSMVEGGLGILVTPELFLYRLPFHVHHRLLKTTYRRAISMVYKSNYTLSPVVKSFVSHVQTWVAENTNQLPNDGN